MKKLNFIEQGLKDAELDVFLELKKCISSGLSQRNAQQVKVLIELLQLQAKAELIAQCEVLDLDQQQVVRILAKGNDNVLPLSEHDFRQENVAKMNELKLELYSFQSDVVESFNVTLRALLISGRRVGKGYVSCVIAIIFCLACRDMNVLIIGPTRQNVKSAFWNVLLKEILQDNIPVNLNKAELLLTFPNRSTIQLSGSDNEQKLRGISPTPDLIILDEFRELKPTLFDEIVSPMLNQNNFLLIVSTPDTVGSQLYDLWETYKDDPLWSVFKINGELAQTR